MTLDVWETQRHRRSAAGLAFDFWGAAVQIHDRLHQREAEAYAFGATRGISPIKTIEHARQMFGGDTGAIVFDRDLGARATISDGDFDRSAGICMPHRVF